MNILQVKDVTMQFGGIIAVNQVSLELKEQELVGLIGPNGAGKTTLFNALTGVYTPTSGEIVYLGKSIKGKSPSKLAENGIARTFQNIRLFKEMTVMENVLVALHSKHDVGLIATLLRFPKFYKTEKTVRKEAYELLKIFGLEDKRNYLAKNLPYGEQRRLEIVRALALKPKLLFLDEPAAGMNPQETEQLTQLIQKVRKDFNLTVLLIEHDMSLVMNICERIYVLETGSLIAQGNPESIKNNKAVIKAYLGDEAC